MLCSSAEELRAVIPNVPGSIPGVTYIFVVISILGVILVRGTILDFGFPGTVGTPLACRFGMMCSCILRSHATRTEGTFCSVVENCVLIFRHVTCAVFEVLRTKILFCVDAGRGVTLLIPLYEVLVVPEVAQLLLGGGPDLVDIGFVAEQLLFEEVPVWDEDDLLLLERNARGPA